MRSVCGSSLVSRKQPMPGRGFQPLLSGLILLIISKELVALMRDVCRRQGNALLLLSSANTLGGY
jgi:hypothetical protein